MGWSNAGWRSDQGGWYKNASAAGYTGPGDLTPGAAFWGGLRAYNAAYAAPGTGGAIIIVDGANANSQTINILSTGLLDYATLNTWIGLHGTPHVSQIFDQSGNGNHLVQATVSAMPTIVISPPGLTAGRAAFQFSAASLQQMSTATAIPTVSQPLTISTVVNRTSMTPGTRFGVATSGGAVPRFGLEDNTNTFFQFAGGALLDIGTSANNTWYGLQAFFGGGASLINVNGVDTGTHNPGASGVTPNLTFGQSGGGDFMTGYACEIGVWSGNISASMGSNQKAAWGY